MVLLLKPYVLLLFLAAVALTFVNVGILPRFTPKTPQTSTSSENNSVADQQQQLTPPPVEYYLFSTVPDSLKVHQKNAIRSWLVLNPPPSKILLFCDNGEQVVNQIFENQFELMPRKHLLVTLSPNETTADGSNDPNAKRYPFLNGLFRGALNYVKPTFNKANSHLQNDYFLAYANGDIILTQSFARSMVQLENIRKERNPNATAATSTVDVFGIARRFNLELGNMELQYSLNNVTRQDSWLQLQRKQLGKLFTADAQDVFVFTPRTFSFEFVPGDQPKEKPFLLDEDIAVPNFVVASVAWDNWLTAYAFLRRNRILSIDISPSAIVIHHNHGKLLGSHDNDWAKHNRQIFGNQQMGGRGFITDLPYLLDKRGNLVHRNPGQDISEYASE